MRSETALRQVARTTGALYLLTIVAGIFAQALVSEKLITESVTATAANLLAHKSLYQAGFAVYLVEMASQVAATALFFYLLEPVSRPVALVSAFVGLAGCVIKTVARMFFIAPLFILSSPQNLAGMSLQQLQSLSYVFLEVNDKGAEIALVFFGFYALLNGYLVFRSTFLPRFLGVLGMIGGIGWLTFLDPPLGHRLFLIIVPFALIGSLSMIFWLLIKGVDAQRWKARAGPEGNR